MQDEPRFLPFLGASAQPQMGADRTPSDNSCQRAVAGAEEIFPLRNPQGEVLMACALGPDVHIVDVAVDNRESPANMRFWPLTFSTGLLVVGPERGW